MKRHNGQKKITHITDFITSNIKSNIAYYYTLYIQMFNWSNATEDSIFYLSHYSISLSNIYFNHLWLMLELVLQTAKEQGKC